MLTLVIEVFRRSVFSATLTESCFLFCLLNSYNLSYLFLVEFIPMSALQLSDPQTTVATISDFLCSTLQSTGKTHIVVAVSGGIDSSLVLTLLRHAFPASSIHPILLPYATQSTELSRQICTFNDIPTQNIREINIQPIVDAAVSVLGSVDAARKGNLMARARMMVVYDIAKSLDGLVCGTENKSEKLLGYFTRFGDEASDLEPIAHLYKTQVRQLVEYFGLPAQIQTQAPSAGLWAGQTDEGELGFGYADADRVLFELVDQGKADGNFDVAGVDPIIVRKVLDRVRSQQFKNEVPYEITLTPPSQL